MPRHAARWVEFLILFVLGPLLFAEFVRRQWLGPRIFIVLWCFAAGCLAVLLLDRTFDRRVLWRVTGFRRHMRVILARFAGAALTLTVCVWLFVPDSLLRLPRHRLALWALIMLFYPLLSAYPQGVIYRAFIFHRYRPLVGDGVGLVALSTLAFTLCHAVFGNWIAIGLTGVGGFLFAWTYWRSRSLTIAWLEHALYGCFVFTIGLGAYLYAGNR